MICERQGDGIVFKHRAIVVFKCPDGTLPVDPARDYDVYHVGEDDDAAAYPDKDPLRMAMLIAQHSASIPDQYSITYTPKSKWDEKVFGVPIKKGEEGVHALMCMGMGGKMNLFTFTCIGIAERTCLSTSIPFTGRPRSLAMEANFIHTSNSRWRSGLPVDPALTSTRMLVMMLCASRGGQ